MKKKIVLLSLTLALVATAIISGTLAWLTDTTSEVKNTFTTAGISITLTETFNTDTNNDGTNDKWQAKMVPGYEYAKDPKVSVDNSTTEDIWLFVEFKAPGSPSTYLNFTSNLTNANGWTRGAGTSAENGDGIPTNVWYRKVGASDATKSWNLLAGKHENADCTEGESCTCKFVNGYVGIKDSLTEKNMPTTDSELIYTAYACQYYKNAGMAFTAAEAWTTVKTTT